MLQITFVYPDFESLGVEYLLSSCKSEGFGVSVVFYYIKDTYTGLFQVDVDVKKIVTDILKKKPDIVVFSCITDNFRYQLRIAEEIKKRSPNVFTLFGGIHVTATWDKVIKNQAVDGVSLGEGEKTLPLFFKKKFCNTSLTEEVNVPGILYKRNDKIIGDKTIADSGDLDEIPFPEKELFYKAMGYCPKEYYIITGRGCPFQCSYCYNSLFSKKIFRRRSVENVIEELKLAKEKFKISYVHFCDDSFTSHRDWLREFSLAYKKQIALPFLCSANPLLVDEEIVKYLKLAGCVDVQIGVQSLSENLCREVLERPSNNEKIEEVIKMIKATKMMVQVDHMLGIPGATTTMEENSLLFYKKLNPELVSVFWLTYYPGTKITRIAKEKGVLSEKELEDIENGFITANMHNGGSVKEKEEFYGLSFLFNFLRYIPYPILKTIIKKKIYKKIKLKNYMIVTGIPRLLLALTDKRYFTGRGHLFRFFHRLTKTLWDKKIFKKKVQKDIIKK